MITDYENKIAEKDVRFNSLKQEILQIDSSKENKERELSERIVKLETNLGEAHLERDELKIKLKQTGVQIKDYEKMLDEVQSIETKLRKQIQETEERLEESNRVQQE